jgi:hypothetical protein
MQKHEVEPANESAFDPQIWQLTDAEVAEKVPAVHSAHAADPDAALYLPASHAEHCPPEPVNPALQLHSALPAVESEWAGQSGVWPRTQKIKH